MNSDIALLRTKKEEYEHFLELKEKDDKLRIQILQLEKKEPELADTLAEMKQESDELFQNVNKSLFGRKKRKSEFISHSMLVQKMEDLYQDVRREREEKMQEQTLLEKQLKEAEEAERCYHALFRRMLIDVRSQKNAVGDKIREIEEKREALEPVIAAVQETVSQCSTLMQTIGEMSSEFSPLYAEREFSYYEMKARFIRFQGRYPRMQAAAENELQALIEKAEACDCGITKEQIASLRGGMESIRKELEEGKRMPPDNWWKPTAIRPSSEQFDLVHVYPGTIVSNLRNDTDLFGTELLAFSNTLRSGLAAFCEQKKAYDRIEEETILNLE